MAGAAKEFPQAFVDDYLRMVRACAEHDRAEVIHRSTRMGFLTGKRSDKPQAQTSAFLQRIYIYISHLHVLHCVYWGASSNMERLGRRGSVEAEDGKVVYVSSQATNHR
jgi:hypothetical protein